MIVYLKIGKKSNGKFKVEASDKPDPSPVISGATYSKKSLPTISFALEVEIPSDAFALGERVISRIVIPRDRLGDITLSLE